MLAAGKLQATPQGFPFGLHWLLWKFLLIQSFDYRIISLPKKEIYYFWFLSKYQKSKIFSVSVFPFVFK